MSVKIFDTMTTATPNFPLAYAEKINIVKEDGSEADIQTLYNSGELSGGDNSLILTESEFLALPEEEKLNNSYYLYDIGVHYKNGIAYSRKEPISLTMAEYKALEEVDPDQEYIVSADAEGILLGAEDIGYNNAESGIQATTVQGAIDKVAEKIDGLISDTNLTSTTSTLSANKIKNAVTYSFDTQSGSVKYVKFKPSITTVSVIDIYGGKIEILGASKASANPDYKTVKVVRLSYGDWSSYDATQVPSVVHTKIGELYYYPTDEYYYLKLYNYAAFTMTGLATAPEIIASLPVEESAMTLIPETDWGKIDDTSTNTTSTWSSSKIASTMPTTRSLTLKTGYAGYITETYDPTTKVVVYNVNVSGTFKGLGNAIATGLKVPKDATSSSDVMHTTLGLYGTTNVSTGDAQFTRLLVRSYSNPFLDVDIQGEYIINGTITYVTA